MERLVNTDNQELDLTKVYSQETFHFKPKGLWYALDQEWIDWCNDNMEGWVRPNIIKLEIDEANLLILKTKKEVETFARRFNTPIEGSLFASIDWLEVSKTYSGIEIQNYRIIKYNDLLDFMSDAWFLGWDVSSGCIWDLSIIKSFVSFPLEQIIEK